MSEVKLRRRREAAGILAVSQTQVWKFEREGLLTRIRIPGLRAVRYSDEEVQALARKWITSSSQEHA